MALSAPAPTRPLLRYHGGKWDLAEWIISFFGPHAVYTEVFGGGASVLLNKTREGQEFYNDLDREIVNAFLVARDHHAELRRVLELTPFARGEFDVSFKPSPDPVEQARRTIVRAFMGMAGGLTRTNRDGSRQRTGFRCYVRDGRRSGTADEWQTYPEALAAICARMMGVHIECCDAIEMLGRLDRSDALHYVDPPYVHSTRQPGAATHHGAYSFEMADDKHRELGGVLNRLVGAVVLSGYDCELYRELFPAPRWRCERRVTEADGARKRMECLWLNERAQAQIQGFLL